MARNLYLILGIEPDATQEQIKSAYRRKAKQSHPDHHGGSCEPFRNVQEAYETLSNPERRQAYDDELVRQARPRAPSRRVRSTPVRARGCPVEPLIPTEPSYDVNQRASDPFAPWFAEGFGPPLRDLDNRLWTERRATRDLQVSVSLTREQALYGGRVRIRIPVRERCPRCRGYGWLGFHTCWECGGAGTIVTQIPVWIDVPAGVTNGAVGRVSLDRLGVPGVALAVHFDVHG